MFKPKPSRSVFVSLLISALVMLSGGVSAACSAPADDNQDISAELHTDPLGLTPVDPCTQAAPTGFRACAADADCGADGDCYDMRCYQGSCLAYTFTAGQDCTCGGIARKCGASGECFAFNTL